MRRVLALCVYCMLPVSAVCFAQSNQTESLTITTYYPAPYAVFKNLKLSQSTQPFNGPAPEKAGTMYFNQTEQKPYIFDGSAWQQIGSAAAQAGQFYYNVSISPDQCSGSISTETYNNGQLCSGPWYMNITFPQPFSNKVHVIVMLEKASDNVHSPCAHNVTDQWIGYPDKITANGFQLWASGSVIHHNETSLSQLSTCNDASGTYDAWYTRATASWFAISE